jgi:hypothetical protein
MKTRTAILIAGAAALALGTAATMLASDHREAPLIQEDASADIADIYAFPSPENPDALVLVMTVNGFTPQAENLNFHFSPNVRCSFYLDSTGDAIEDDWAHVTFTDRVAGGGAQQFNLELSNGRVVTGDVTLPSEEPHANPPVITTTPDGIRVFCGPREDPFFFDVVGFNRFLAGTGGFSGTDGFAGFNVSTIAIEIPAALVPGGNVTPLQIWGETARRHGELRRSADGRLLKGFGEWEQIERMGNPAISTALIPFDLKDLYNIGEPSNDAVDFAGAIVASLQALGTNQTNIDILAGVAVPDTLKYDPTQPVSYPNGRNLADDVIDVLFFFIFNQQPVNDGVFTNDAAFQAGFPFLADPFQP